MYYSVSYDISDHKARLLAAKLCKKAGLVRVQRSVFMGASLPGLVREIAETLLPKLDPGTDSLCIAPLDRLTYQRNG